MIDISDYGLSRGFPCALLRKIVSRILDPTWLKFVEPLSLSLSSIPNEFFQRLLGDSNHCRRCVPRSSKSVVVDLVGSRINASRTTLLFRAGMVEGWRARARRGDLSCRAFRQSISGDFRQTWLSADRHGTFVVEYSITRTPDSWLHASARPYSPPIPFSRSD